MARHMPSAPDYKAALQNLQLTLTSPDLREYEYVKSRRGGPIIYSGGFAMTSPIQHPRTRKKIALRFFYRLPDDMRERYLSISDFVRRNIGAGLFADIAYEPEGVLVNGDLYPICRMDWLEGDTLRVYVSRHLNQPEKIEPLADKFAIMVEQLHSMGGAHGDLSHENIMVVNDEIMLVDYDGMYVPALNGRRPCVVGQPNFQHPGRISEGAYFGPYQDDFSAIAIYISLLALQYDPTLYHRYENGGNSLLFAKQDFIDPDSSPFLAELEQVADLASLVEGFRTICQLSVRHVPSLKDFLAGKRQLTTGIRILSLAPLADDQIFTPEGNPVFNAMSPDQEILKRAQGHTGTLTGRVNRVAFETDSVILEFTDGVKMTSAIFLIDEAYDELMQQDYQAVIAQYQGKWVKATGPIQVTEINGEQEPTVEIASLQNIAFSTLEEIGRLQRGMSDETPSDPPPGQRSDWWRRAHSQPPPPAPKPPDTGSADNIFKRKNPFEPLS